MKQNINVLSIQDKKKKTKQNLKPISFIMEFYFVFQVSNVSFTSFSSK